MPTVYHHRVGISLYDAQYSAGGERQPIDDQTITAVLSALQQFKMTCKDFGVPEEHITILATEATRTAHNSADFRQQIKHSVGVDVTLLPKAEEGRIGAMGVASSLPQVSGLVMDLGGGSTQLSWLTQQGDQERVTMPAQGAVSMPYGAAAMSRRLQEAEKTSTLGDLRAEVLAAVKEAYATFQIPRDLQKSAEKRGGFTLYLSGGGFRGWGYALMSKHRVQPFPVPVINGFKATRREFLDTEGITSAASSALDNGGDQMFRVSERRASQVPAVAFLISAIAEALPQIEEVRFCQGGVREGYLFSTMSLATSREHPLIVATEPFDSQQRSQAVVRLLQDAVPSGTVSGTPDHNESVFAPAVLTAFTNLMYYHSSHSKDLQATSALRSTTSGILANVHGVLHEDRTVLALLLCSRWGGKVPSSDEQFKCNLEKLVESSLMLWWINYLGVIAQLIAHVYPAGIREQNLTRLSLRARWDADEKRRSLLRLELTLDSDISAEAVGKEVSAIEKVGKKKNWIGGKTGVGHKVAVEVIAAR
ncbi:hypothetical protein B0A50_02643 [Salinomyces thailandicus]|uniref:Uncharacterized protein n=1 Tax=Salinomyces thailandicus TaxID=706561 RepID=A0A4U0U7L0_9PEZI|nr:hypothetical protein B0A50_02643 [Salinomyces thailandica]